MNSFESTLEELSLMSWTNSMIIYSKKRKEKKFQVKAINILNKQQENKFNKSR